MPVVIPNTHANGTRMEWEDIQENAVAVRAWVNDIPETDIDTGVIRREHLVRPVIGNGDFRSTFQEAYQAPLGIRTISPFTALEDDGDNIAWGTDSERTILLPRSADGDGLIRTRIGRTRRLVRSSDVEVHCTFQALVVADPAEAAYPDGAGGPANAAVAGYFAIHAYRRSTGAETVYNFGRQDVYPAFTYERVHVLLVDTLAAGVWDFTLVYHRDTAPDEILQIDIARANMTIEVL
jgi:hypothetical protein